MPRAAVDGVQNYFIFLVQLLGIFAGLHSIDYLLAKLDIIESFMGCAH